ncbi:hypothetical protein [Vogesella indigofera]|nr:hypothetical protein [Vogesella indigofera]MDC7705932.1 hypothetical protein [Vogesella indigofera]
MKQIISIMDAFGRLIVTLHTHPVGAMVAVLLATCLVAAGWAWRR